MTVSRKTLTLAETFFQEEVKLEIDVKSSISVTLLATFNANKISINQSCGGNGTCGTCRVEIVQNSDFLKPQSDYENEVTRELNLQPQQRLSCQAEINLSSNEKNLVVKIVNEVTD
jgi:ferredoxin, 2Fe-2S